jgi:hypothetical protein
MAINTIQNSVTAAGDINIEEVVLITSSGEELNIILYIGELNIFEDMFRTGLYGNMVVLDNFNLTSSFNLTGDEFLRIKAYTPSMSNDAIYKTFKIYSITDRIMLNDTGRQTYIMHFCSPEILIDALSPIYKTFEGPVDQVVTQIFENYVSTSRNGNNDYSTLNIIGQTNNMVKFTSPGWRPLKCLNWLAAKSLGSGYKAPGYVFFESNKAFYFANIEQIIDAAVKSKSYYQDYYYFANNHNFNTANTQDIDRQYQLVEDMKVVESFNSLKNRLYTLDVVTKKIETYDYDHVLGYNEYTHMEDLKSGKGSSIPPFVSGENGINALRAAGGYNQIAMQHFGLYTGFANNAADRAKDILPRRISVLNELQNLKIEITVPGRTDIEVGSMVNFHYPDASPRDAADLALGNEDKLYSGMYLITAIRHRINIGRHMMILELVKDSYRGN